MTLGGQIIDEISVDDDSFTIDMKGYISGAYFLKIITEEKTFVNKVIRVD
jgi:hypothetical protein